jgi:hypothetical protein
VGVELRELSVVEHMVGRVDSQESGGPSVRGVQARLTVVAPVATLAGGDGHGAAGAAAAAGGRRPGGGRGRAGRPHRPGGRGGVTGRPAHYPPPTRSRRCSGRPPGSGAALAELLDRTAGGGLADRPRIAVTDALSGALLALTDAPAPRAAAAAGRGLGPPGPGPGYRPGAALDRYLRARDRRCRFPGCRRPVPRGGEPDHTRPWPDGATAAANLTGFCGSHHRGKHQAPGWDFDLAPDGTLTVTTPTGLVATTEPPPY